jgi:pSer/pThr/pTyr-binding forkhead associated (FHA) protein
MTSHHVILTATHGAWAGHQFTFAGRSQCVIGRASACSLRLPWDVTVSRHHCLLDIDAPVIAVRDLGSLNGTFVNGHSIGHRPEDGRDVTFKLPAPYPLYAGDQLRIGQNVFRIDIAETPATAKGNAEMNEPREAVPGEHQPERCVLCSG